VQLIESVEDAKNNSKPDDVARSAKLVGAEVHIYEGLCHTYQAERSWENVAEDVLRFFKATEPNAEAQEC